MRKGSFGCWRRNLRQFTWRPSQRKHKIAPAALVRALRKEEACSGTVGAPLADSDRKHNVPTMPGSRLNRSFLVEMSLEDRKSVSYRVGANTGMLDHPAEFPVKIRMQRPRCPGSLPDEPRRRSNTLAHRLHRSITKRTHSVSHGERALLAIPGLAADGHSSHRLR